MSARVRVLVAVVVAIVALYFVIAQPEAAASTVRSVVGAIVDAFGRIGTFVRSLFNPGAGS